MIVKKFYVVYEVFQDHNGYWEMYCDIHDTKEEALEQAERMKTSNNYSSVKILTDI